jgi:hypothetical protein
MASTSGGNGRTRAAITKDTALRLLARMIFSAGLGHLSGLILVRRATGRGACASGIGSRWRGNRGCSGWRLGIAIYKAANSGIALASAEKGRRKDRWTKHTTGPKHISSPRRRGESTDKPARNTNTVEYTHRNTSPAACRLTGASKTLV